MTVDRASLVVETVIRLVAPPVVGWGTAALCRGFVPGAILGDAVGYVLVRHRRDVRDGA